MRFSDLSFNQEALKIRVESKKWISIEEDSKLFDLLLRYIPQHPNKINSNTESFTVDVLSSGIKKPVDNDEEKTASQIGVVVGRIALKIGYGQYTFSGYNGEKYDAIYQTIGEPVGSRSGVAIMRNLIVFTDGPIEQLAKFLTLLVENDEKTADGIFACFVWHIQYKYWRTESKVTARSIDSVVIPSAIKNKLIGDLDKFFSPRTKSFYNRNGIPYRRSYLFHGLPGTGKTSMVNALAGHFHRSVCYLMPTHPQMTDDSLREAINKIPDNSIVVFEDIDSLFSKDRSNKMAKSALTFSGLLNALDGVGNTNGQVYVLTTNLRDQLDPALIRNGRVDIHIEFTYATEEQMCQMWSNFYPEAVDVAAQFASTVVDKLAASVLEVTTAGLQHFFVTQMDSTAEEALANVDCIVADILENNARAKEDADLRALEEAAEALELSGEGKAGKSVVEVEKEEGVTETKESSGTVTPNASE